MGEGNLKALLSLQLHLCGIFVLIIFCAELRFRSQEFERSHNCFQRMIHWYLDESINLSALWFLFRNMRVMLHPLVAKIRYTENYLASTG